MKKVRVKKGNVSSIIIMIIITSLIMVTTTYAWFTISNTPKVNGLSMTAGTSGSLKIASENNGSPGTYQDTLDFDANYFSSVKLAPVTTADGISFYSPTYNDDGTGVTDFKMITATNLLKSVGSATFYLKAESSQYATFDICLLGGGNATFVNGTSALYSAQDSVRVSFTIQDSNGTKTVIYEPNSDATLNSTTRATNASGNTTYGGYTTIAQHSDLSFYSNGVGSTRSDSLFTINTGEDVKITMKVWIEGMDKDCVNEIAKDTISAAIKFITKVQ